mgnify:CR=1 FL=1
MTGDGICGFEPLPPFKVDTLMFPSELTLDIDTASLTVRLRALAQECAQSAPAEEDARVCEALALLGGRATAKEVGGMDCVLRLLGEDVGFLCSRGRGGVCLAMLAVDGADEEVCVQGATPALALLGAWASAWLVHLGDVTEEPREAASARLH